MGHDATSPGAYSAALGSNTKAAGSGDLAIGTLSTTAASTQTNGNIVIGADSGTADAATTAVRALANGGDAIAIGTASVSKALKSTALGAYSSATAAGSVALGSGSVASVANTVSVGAAGATRKIVNVTAGTVSATSTDAVNGAQLYAAEHQIAQVATETVQGRMPASSDAAAEATAEAALTTADSVESAANAATTKATTAVTTAKSAVSTSRTAQTTARTAQTTANRAEALAQTAVQYDTPSQTSVTLNPGGAAAGIHNVAAGVASTDAANVGQVSDSVSAAESYAATSSAATLSAANNYTNAVAAQLSGRIETVASRANAATAAALASTDIPQAIRAGHAMVGFGVGTWGGETGFAAGLSTRLSDDHTTLKASVNFDSRGQGGGGAGVGFEF
jgi:autotransporter adhesin